MVTHCTDLPMGLHSGTRSQCAADPLACLLTSLGHILSPGLESRALTHSAPPLGAATTHSLITSYQPSQWHGSRSPEDCGGQLCGLGQAPYPL